MRHDNLPQTARDVLDLPASHVAQSLQRMSREKQLSRLVQRLNDEERSDNPDVRARAVAALRHLGFTD